MDPAPQIRSKTLDELEASLRDFERLYAAAEGDAARRSELRAMVIKAKDRARFASRNPKAPPEKRAAKAEMLEWMLVWLDDPSLFVHWVSLRRAAAEHP